MAWACGKYYCGRTNRYRRIRNQQLEFQRRTAWMVCWYMYCDSTGAFEMNGTTMSHRRVDSVRNTFSQLGILYLFRTKTKYFAFCLHASFVEVHVLTKVICLPLTNATHKTMSSFSNSPHIHIMWVCAVCSALVHSEALSLFPSPSPTFRTSFYTQIRYYSTQ